MRILITIMILWSSTMAFGQEIWQLSPWAPDSSYVIGAMNSGEPTWVKVDSLGLADSIYLSGDNIKLRDGAGVAQLPTASTSTKGLLTSTDWNTFNGKVGGSGVATRVAFWNGANSLSSNSELYWNNVNNRLGVGTSTPATILHIKGSGYTDHLRIQGSGGGSGISFNGGTNTEYLFYNDINNSFCIGGGGSGGTNKKVHINGGVTIGTSNRTSNLNGNNQLWVEGNALFGSSSFSPTNDHVARFIGSNAIQLPYGYTSERPNGLIGSFRLNSNTARLEYYYPTQWFQVLASNSNLMQGSVLFADVNGNVDEDNNYLFYNKTNKRLGVGTKNPITGFHVIGGSNVGTFQYDAYDTPLRVLNNTSFGTGMKFQDVSGNHNIYYNQGTFAIGGNGNYVLNKRVHVDGGMTIGQNYDGHTVGQSSLRIEGSLSVDTKIGIGSEIAMFDINNKIVSGNIGTGLSIINGTLSASGSTEYLDPYVISSDTVGFILKNVMDTVQFIGVAGVTGESTTVSDSPTINMTLTGTNISSEVIDGSITPTKLSQTYLITEVDGSTTNEIQTLSIAGNNLTISGAGGNTVTLPSGGGSSEWASLHYGSLAANTQTLTSSVWNTINFTGSSESNAAVLDANHTNDEIEFVSAGTYRVDYRVSFIANADALIYSGIYSSASSSVDSNTQMESDTDSGYKHTIMQHSYIKTAVAGEKIKLQVQPLIAHTSVAIYSNFIVTKL